MVQAGLPPLFPELSQLRVRGLQARAPPLPHVQGRLQADAARQEHCRGEDLQPGPVKYWGNLGKNLLAVTKFLSQQYQIYIFSKELC